MVHIIPDQFYYHKEVFALFLQKPDNEKIHQTLKNVC